MENVKFYTEDESTSWDMANDYKVILAHREIGAPKQKTDFVNIPYRNGVINVYDYVTDQPIFESRDVIMDFIYLGNANKTDLMAAIYEAIHAKSNLLINFSDDAAYFYKAYVTNIEKVEQDRHALKFRVNCTCHPYKFDKVSTVVDWAWDDLDLVNGIINDYGEIVIAKGATATFNLMCRAKRGYPEIVSTAYFRITKGTQSIRVGGGKTKIYDIELVEGLNSLSITNLNPLDPSTLKINYRGEVL